MTDPVHTPEGHRLEGATCLYCGGGDIRVHMKIEPKPLGTWSLSGNQLKTVAREWPYATCQQCGHSSRGTLSD